MRDGFLKQSLVSLCLFQIFSLFFSPLLIFFFLFSDISESLFQPVFKNKVTQSPMPSGLRFSTFGYLDSSTPGAQCPTHSQTNKGTLPHQHHHHYHHIHSNSNQSSPDGIDKGTGTPDRMDEFRATIDNDDKQRKFLVKKDDAQARSFSDVRKSAPDVIIIAGCTSSH